MVIPHGEAEYYRWRPLIAIPKPGTPGKTALEIDRYWGMHPALEPLFPFYENKELAFVHAVGWPGHSYSHFEAIEKIESGQVGDVQLSTGWLARYLQTTAPVSQSGLRGVAFAETMPRLLTGTLGVSCIRNPREYRLTVAPGRWPAVQGALRGFYDACPALAAFGKQALDVLEIFDRINSGDQAGNDGYPQTEFGMQMKAVEALVRADVGLEPAWS